MDGNGRWAQGRGLPVAAGHRAGAKALRRVLEHALDLGIEEVTVYSFSTENWNRPKDEVEALMQLFVEMIDSQVPDMHERGRARALRRASRRRAGRAGAPHRGGRGADRRQHQDDAVHRLQLRRAARAAGRGRRAWRPSTPRPRGATRSPGAARPEFTEDDLRRHLYAPEMHDPELLIRTSGELRISNFLLWQCAYAELYFSDRLLAGLRPRGPGRGAGRLRRPPAPLRRAPRGAPARPAPGRRRDAGEGGAS